MPPSTGVQELTTQRPPIGHEQPGSIGPSRLQSTEMGGGPHSGPSQIPPLQTKPSGQTVPSLQSMGGSQLPVVGLQTSFPSQSSPLLLQSGDGEGVGGQEPPLGSASHKPEAPHTWQLGQPVVAHVLLSWHKQTGSPAHTWPAGQPLTGSWQFGGGVQLGSVSHLPLTVQLWQAGQPVAVQVLSWHKHVALSQA